MALTRQTALREGFGDRLEAGDLLPVADNYVLVEMSFISESGLARQVEAALNVPNCQTPLFVAAELGDFHERILVLVRLNPKACETGRDIF